MQARRAHPARTVVLLPYAQLMPQAARSWARLGEMDRAARALQAARSTSEGVEHSRYQAKLESLRRHGSQTLQARRSG